MDTINRENKQVIIMGDFNINLLKFGSHNKTSDYLDNIFPVMVLFPQYPNQLELPLH